MASFNDIRDRAKTIWMKGVDSIGNTAANIASSTRSKVDEISLQNRRKEVSQDLSGKVYALWQKGEVFPAEIEQILKELRTLDEKLDELRAARAAQGETPAAEPEDEAAASEFPEIPEDRDARETEFMTDLEAHMQRTMEDPSSTLSKEINARFDRPEVAEKADKVNSSLDQLSDHIKRFDENNGDQEQP